MLSLNLKKKLYSYLYRFNVKVLPWTNVTIANTKFYESCDEYCTLRMDGWVTVRSKEHPKNKDMIPVSLVSETTLRKLVYSMGRTDEEIDAEVEEE